MAFKYNNEINMFGTNRVIIIISKYRSLKLYFDDNEKNEVYIFFFFLIVHVGYIFVLVFFFLGF